MPLVKLLIQDRFSVSVLEKTYTCPDISIALDKFRTKYPDCWVSLVAVEDNKLHNAIDGRDFAFFCPLNMTKDEILVMNDEMDLKAYQMKWYPDTRLLSYQEDMELEVEDTEEFEYDMPDPDCD